MATENTSSTFKLIWRGGFSYLTYLLKETTITLKEQEVDIQTQKKVLGIIPSGTDNKKLAYSDVRKITTGTKISWFQLLFAIFFAAIAASLLATGSGIRWVALIAAAVFFWLSFRSTHLTLSNRTGATTSIRSDSKKVTGTLLERLVQRIDQVQPGQVDVIREGKAKKAIVASLSALVIIIFAVASLTSKEGNPYIELVQNSAFAETKYSMQDIVEHSEYFSNPTWKMVTYDGASDLDNYVMYEGSFSESGVQVLTRAIFQVFGETHFEVVEFSVDGELFEPAFTEFNMFIAHVVDKIEGRTPTAADFETTETNEVGQADNSEAITTETPVNEEIIDTEPVASPAQAEIPSEPANDALTLNNFLQWIPSNEPLISNQILDGNEIIVTIERDNPIGNLIQAHSALIDGQWDIPLPVSEFMDTPFDDDFELRSGFNFYLTYHDFSMTNDVPKLIIAASDEMLETYVWVYEYNFLYAEDRSNPFNLIWSGEGQSNVFIQDDSILLPFGSQGLFEEYMYKNSDFIKIN